MDKLNDEEFDDYEEEELEPTRPLSAERQAEIDELYALLEATLAEIFADTE